MDVSCHRPFLPGTSLEPAVIPTAQASTFHTAVLSVLCVMFQVQLSFVKNLSNVFLVQLPNFSLSFSLLFHYYYYYYYYYLLQLSFHSVAVVLTLKTNDNKYT